MSMNRSILRAMAHENMKKSGVQNPNKKDQGSDKEKKTSKFSRNWRLYCNGSIGN